MTYGPPMGKTPNDWAEEEARRRERHERVHNPHGRELGANSRLALQIILGLALGVMVVVTVLGLLGIVDIFLVPGEPA